MALTTIFQLISGCSRVMSTVLFSLLAFLLYFPACYRGPVALIGIAGLFILPSISTSFVLFPALLFLLCTPSGILVSRSSFLSQGVRRLHLLYIAFRCFLFLFVSSIDARDTRLVLHLGINERFQGIFTLVSSSCFRK
jgi:hypothetical protein